MTGYKEWADLEVLTAEELQGFIQTQVIPRGYATVAAADTAFTDASNGAVCDVLGLGLMRHSGGVWVPMTGRAILQARQILPQSLDADTDTAITLTSQDFNLTPGEGHSITVNPSRFTAKFPGWYLFSGSVGYSINATGNRHAFFCKNGLEVDGSAGTTAAASGGTTKVVAQTSLVSLNANDYVELYGRAQGVGLDTSSGTGHFQSMMTVVYAGTNAAGG